MTNICQKICTVGKISSSPSNWIIVVQKYKNDTHIICLRDQIILPLINSLLAIYDFGLYKYLGSINISNNLSKINKYI